MQLLAQMRLNIAHLLVFFGTLLLPDQLQQTHSQQRLRVFYQHHNQLDNLHHSLQIILQINLRAHLQGSQHRNQQGNQQGSQHRNQQGNQQGSQHRNQQKVINFQTNVITILIMIYIIY